MLMYHSDSQPIGIIGIGNGCLFLINVNLSRIRMIQPEKDIHQGAFAGSVAADEANPVPVLNFQPPDV